MWRHALGHPFLWKLWKTYWYFLYEFLRLAFTHVVSLCIVLSLNKESCIYIESYYRSRPQVNLYFVNINVAWYYWRVLLSSQYIMRLLQVWLNQNQFKIWCICQYWVSKNKCFCPHREFISNLILLYVFFCK